MVSNPHLYNYWLPFVLFTADSLAQLQKPLFFTYFFLLLFSCQAYSELLAEVQRLRKQLNISSDSKGVQTNVSASLNDSLQLSKNDTVELTQSSKSNITDKQKISPENTLRATLKGEMGDTRVPKNQAPEDKKRNEAFNSEVNNLRGDPGVLLNRMIKSSDHTERKLEKSGEFWWSGFQ